MGGGDIHFKTGEAILWNKNKQTIGIGKVISRLYLLNAQAELPAQEKASLATIMVLVALEKLNKKNLGKGLVIDKSSIPLHACEACIQAKQVHQLFSKEAENRSTVAEEHIMGDVWGLAHVESIVKWKYYLSLTDNAKVFCHNAILMNQRSGTISDQIFMVQ